ncbi:MAG: hypothetical protein L0221_02395 [Chloroflexi bacterium]|nr:hypothetical protein [Chloroflexota bacterium]
MSARTVARTCSCLLPNHDTRGIVLYAWVAMPAGTTPEWEIFADLGG